MSRLFSVALRLGNLTRPSANYFRQVHSGSPPATNMSVKDFLKFLDASPTPYHAVQSCVNHLTSQGFKQLKLTDTWDLKKNGKEHTTIVAFIIGGKYEASNGYVVVGAHTDSPCLRVRPVSKLVREGFKQVSLDTYGGGIWRTWFDRSLGLAGIVTVRRRDKQIEHVLVDFERKPILCIPNLAIHLETDRSNPKIDLEEHLQPIFCLNDPAAKSSDFDKCDHHVELLHLIGDAAECAIEDIIDFDLRTFATEPAQLCGVNDEFIMSGRLDNLFGVFTAIHGLTEAAKELTDSPNAHIAVAFDHEECGSNSATGAQSAVFEHILRRIVLSREKVTNDTFSRAISQSFIISADQAHAAHPNFPDRHERNHRPRFDGSVVVKISPNQRYATTITSHSILSELARQADVKLTKFVVKNTSPCGSTIGPFLSSNLSALTIDVGCAQLSMHSCRECGDAKSLPNAIKLYATTFAKYHEVLDSITE